MEKDLRCNGLAKFCLLDNDWFASGLSVENTQNRQCQLAYSHDALKAAITTLTSFVFPLLFEDDSESLGGLDGLLVAAFSFSSGKK